MANICLLVFPKFSQKMLYPSFIIAFRGTQLLFVGSKYQTYIIFYLYYIHKTKTEFENKNSNKQVSGFFFNFKVERYKGMTKSLNIFMFFIPKELNP